MMRDTRALARDAREAATKSSALRLLGQTHAITKPMQATFLRERECGSRPARRDLPARRQKRVRQPLGTLPVE
jgi:hypothetical protein